MKHSKLLVACAAASLLVATGGSGPAISHEGGVPGIKILVENIRKHQAALQAVADANGGTRASGTPGFEASVAYVKGKLTAAGFTVTEQPFDFPFFQEFSAPELEQLSPVPTTYVAGVDIDTMQYSGSGNVTALVEAVDVVPIADTDPPSTSNSGCEATDFAGFTPGNIALLQRGTCTFALKAQNALAAGAVAAIIYNEGQPGRDGLLQGTLGGPVGLPVLGTTAALGESLVAQLAGGDVELRLATDTDSSIKTTWNLIADLPGGRPDRVVVVGAHLDSVLEGAGIQDNGSGSAMNLEMALRMKKHHLRPKNKVRFIWFGAEEAGLLGSEHYVANLTPSELSNIYLNLNFDMVASPNFVRFVYDGDGSDTPDAGPPGSDVIEQVFKRFFDWKHLPVEPTAFDGRSDYGPFIDAGIPAGGLFTGAEALKTAEQQAIYGGTEGIALDPCYHQACDNYDNNNEKVLGQMTAAAGFTTMWFAYKSLDAKPPKQRKAQKASNNWLYKGSHLQR
jgi:Zn-dependent M28 family amino/carboxypeptidase